VVEEAFRSMTRGAVALERFAEDTNGGLVYTFTTPWSNGRTGITLSPVELLEKLAVLVPLPHSSLRGTITPTPHQQGVEGDDTATELPCWSWARLLK
jgi:Putative transposase